MTELQRVTLRRAAPNGVECDGLVVSHDRSGYTFETPATRHEQLDAEAFDDVAADHPWLVSNWHYWHQFAEPSRRDFLRWVEGADDRSVADRYDALPEGLSREWGQLHITAELAGAGERRYHLRHVADAGAEVDSLDTYTDPLDARDLAKHDDAGRYRPLKTAPTLVDGWAFVDLTGRELLQTVDFFYPATVANWYREQEGELDVTHFRETAERQTGIYDVIDELPQEAVEWVAGACCVDSQCLKRREWDEDVETPLDVPRGDGEFPCREPCSLVVAAARKWTKLEQEEEQTYEVTMTESELAQLADLVDAVAEGRTDEIREADVYDGANRYRARYLRAKRMDDAGRFENVTERSAIAGTAARTATRASRPRR
ncbi:DR2241 family protein [Haladaptatus sp. GCM10025893]|uniref:DR2241 family protein n=2 Tax=Haladaptatus TaxID=367188 RepID=UPI00361F69D5